MGEIKQAWVPMAMLALAALCVARPQYHSFKRGFIDLGSASYAMAGLLVLGAAYLLFARLRGK